METAGTGDPMSRICVQHWRTQRRHNIGTPPPNHPASPAMETAGTGGPVLRRCEPGPAAHPAGQ
eukprot:1136340-Pelagomonas_calceolata.AAC.1